MPASRTRSASAWLLPQYANRWVLGYVLLQVAVPLLVFYGGNSLVAQVPWLRTGSSRQWLGLLSILLSVLLFGSALLSRMGRIGWQHFHASATPAKSPPGLLWRRVVWLSALVISLNVALNTALQYLVPPPHSLYLPALPQLPYAWLYQLLQILLLAGFIPILEELLFRGYVLRAYLAHRGRLQAIGMSTLVFVLAHLNLYQLGASLSIGLVLASRVSRGLPLYLACIVHAVNNGAALLSQWLSQSGQPPSLGQAIAGGIIGLGGLGLVLWSSEEGLEPTTPRARPALNSRRARVWSMPLLCLLLLWLLRVISQVLVSQHVH